MSPSALRVAIVGGGLGGLCLAQGLVKAGIQVAVYERDPSRDARTQGYRIHISPEGSAALHACLPTHLWKILSATVGDFSRGFTIMTEQQQELLCLTLGQGRPSDPIRRHRSVSRITLRYILLAGLDGIVHFDKRFVRYDRTPSGIVAHFEDGSAAEADLLVGADGVHSRVRAQYLPQAEPIDTGVVGIGGTIPLTDDVLSLAPPQLFIGPVMVLPPTPGGLFMAMWKRSAEAAAPLRQLGIEGPIPGDDDYLIFALGAQRSYFRLDDFPSEDEIRSVFRDQMTGWHPAFPALLDRLPPGHLFLNSIRTSRPQPAWAASEVTLLGDAIHSMTPYRGIGGNIALQDAALLCSKLAYAQAGRQPLLAAVAEYETAMRQYAFKAVADSFRAMQQFTGPKKQPAFSLMKLGMRAANFAMRLRRGKAR